MGVLEVVINDGSVAKRAAPEEELPFNIAANQFKQND